MQRENQNMMVFKTTEEISEFWLKEAVLNFQKK
jgi:hypothetical protein